MLRSVVVVALLVLLPPARARGESGDGLRLALGTGAGFGYGAYATPQGRQSAETFHLFLGLPIPLDKDITRVIDATWFPYMLPYYRPSWGPWPGVAHEGGVMFKLSYALVKGHFKIGG